MLSVAVRKKPKTPSATRLSGAKARGRYHHGDLRRALLDAALELIAEAGPRGMTLREAARRARVSQAAPYRHFESRAALLAAVAEEGFRTFGAGQRAAWERHPDDAFARFEALGLDYVDFAVRNPSHFRVMFGWEIENAARFPELVTVARASRAPIEETVQAMLRQLGRDPTLPAMPVAREAPRELPPALPDAAATLVGVWATVHGLAFLLIERRLPAEPTPEAAALFTRSVLRSLSRGLQP